MCLFVATTAAREGRTNDTSVHASEKNGLERRKERERGREREGNAWIHRRVHTRAAHTVATESRVRTRR